MTALFRLSICIICIFKVAPVAAWSSGTTRSAASRRRASILQPNDYYHGSETTRSRIVRCLNQNDNEGDVINDDFATNNNNGELERLKKEEQRLSSLLDSIRQQKLAVLRSRPLTIGIVGFGRFGQFCAKSFTKYGQVVATSRTNYTDVALEMGVTFAPDLESFVMDENLDVIVLATSIVSFKDTVIDLVPLLEKKMELMGASSCPLIVDVASVKEHPRNIMLDLLPEECDILCTHPSKFLIALLACILISYSQTHE